MEKIIATNKWTTFDKDGNGHLMVTIDGEDIEISTIPNAQDLSIDSLKERIDLILKINNIDVVIPQPVVKPKRKYTRHVKLDLASNFGKVTLKLATPNKQYGYIIYLKDTNKYVYRFDEKGIYVIEEGKKTKPMIWSEDDIKIIRNSNDFDFKKVEVSKKPKNRLA